VPYPAERLIELAQGGELLVGRGIDRRCDQRDAIAEPVDALALGSGFGGAVWAAAMVGT